MSWGSSARLIFTCTLGVAALACAFIAVGCGEKQEPLATAKIAIAIPSSGPLTTRGRDMLDAAKLSIQQGDGKTETAQLELVEGETEGAIASISALAPIDGGQGLTINLAAPVATPNKPEMLWLLPTAFTNGRAVGQFAAIDSDGYVDPFTSGGAFNDVVADGVKFVIKSGGLPTGGGADPAPTLTGGGAMAQDHPILADNPETPGEPKFTYVSPALTEDNYPPAGKRFFKLFREEYDREPDRFAIFAYEAVSAVFDAVRRLEKADKPVTPEIVRAEALAITDRFGPIGHYDVRRNGLTTAYLFEARGKNAPPPDAALIEVGR